MPRSRTGTVVPIKGKFYARVLYTDAAGKERHKYKQGRTRSEAKTHLRRMLNELESAGREAFDGDKMTFAEVAARYAETRLVPAEYRDDRKVAGVRSLPTVKGYLAVLVDYFGRRRVRSITYGDLEQFKLARLNAPARGGQRKIASVNRELQLLRAVLHHAHREGWILQNPFQRGRALISKADEAKRDRILTREEEARLLAACTGRRAHLRPILICALDTAMRRGEMWRLTWADVDLTENVIRVRALTTKTLEARLVPVTPRLRAELEKLWWAARDKKLGPVFGIKDTIKTAWAAACKAAAVSDFRLHDCRHTAITRMIQAGVPPLIAQKVSGHTQINTFLRYLNPDTSIVQQAAAALARLTEEAEKEIG